MERLTFPVAEQGPRTDAGAPASGLTLLAAANHDLRQPLQAAQLFHATLRRRNRDPGLAKTIDNLGQALEGLATALEPLIAIARLDAGRESPVPSRFPVAEIMSRVCDRIEAPLHEGAVALAVVASSADITTDPALLETLVRHLVLGGLALVDGRRAVLGYRRSAGSWRLQLAISGGAVPVTSLDTVFEAYQHIPPTARAAAWASGVDLVVAGRCARVLKIGITTELVRGRGVVFDLAPV